MIRKEAPDLMELRAFYRKEDIVTALPEYVWPASAAMRLKGNTWA